MNLLGTGIEAIELSALDVHQNVDALRMEELGRRAPSNALPRRFVGEEAVVGLGSTVVITWQNQVFLAPIALANGGLGGFFWASSAVFAAMYVVYAGLREKAERWPVSAGQYFWIAQMASPYYAKPLSFVSGWMLLVAWQVFLSAGVMIIGNGAAALVVLHTGTNYFWLPTALSIFTGLFVFSINRWFLRFLAKAEFPIFILHLVVFAIFAITLLGLRPHSGIPYATPRSVFLTFRNGGGWHTSFGAAILSAVVPLSSSIGYDSPCHLSEEIKEASSKLPIGLRWCTRINFVLGLLTVLVINFSVTDIDAMLDTPLSLSGAVGPVVQIIYTATGSKQWTTAIVTLLLATVILCCVNSFIAASRQVLAFADDGGLPGSAWIRKTKNDVPTNVLWLTLIGPVVLPVLNLVSIVALNAVISLVINSLIASYLLVAVTSIYDRCRGGGLYQADGSHPTNHLLSPLQGYAVDIISVVVLCAGFVIVLFPPVSHPTPAQMNWAVVLFGGVCLSGGLLYHFHGRKEYRCPLDKTLSK